MKSIRFKLWSGMMTLVLLVLILLWLFQIVFLESFYTNIKISDVKKEGANVVKLLESRGDIDIQNKLDTLAFKNNIGVEMIDPNGNTIYENSSRTQMPIGMKNTERAELLKNVKGDKEAVIPMTHPKFGIKFMTIGLPIQKSGQMSGVLILNMSLAPVEDTVSILKQQLFYITIILLIAALLISFFMAQSFTKPILEIKKASEAMAKGDFSLRIKPKKHDELGMLAETINCLGVQLAKIEQLRKDFIANVSHELRTPLSIIRGYAETLRDVTGNNPEKREKQLGIIIEESQRLSGLVDDILNLSQIQSGYFTIDKNNVNTKLILDRVLSRYEVLSERTGVKIELINLSNSMIYADAARMEQVLYNLINNAFNHTEKGGTITIEITEKPNTVRFAVSDTGSGIPKEEIPHIWDRYYKAEKTSEKKAVGTGLGLAIVKGVLGAHQATFGVESELNLGTTFWFELKR